MRRKNHCRSDQRRAALRRAFALRGWTPAEVARRAGLSHPSALVNFLSGRTASLSLDTLEPLADTLGLCEQHLIGEREGWVLVKGRKSALKGAIGGVDAWCTGHQWEPQNWIEFAIPEDHVTSDSYFMRLDSDDMDQRWPPGTLLEVVDFRNFEKDLVAGNKVVLTRDVGNGFVMTQVLCREIDDIDIAAGRCRLVPRSTQPRRDEITAAWPLPSDPWIDGEWNINVRAVVIRSYKKEI